MKQMLLHICCAPCSPYVIDLLKKNFNLTLFFYDPNIQPREEYLFRLNEMRILSGEMDLHLIEGKYDEENWNNAIQGHENDKEGLGRCKRCFMIRLSETADLAVEREDDCFATVLTVSPHKNSRTINHIGNIIGLEKNITYFEADFKKKNGFLKNTILANKYGLKRQNYCGCLYSKK